MILETKLIRSSSADQFEERRVSTNRSTSSARHTLTQTIAKQSNRNRKHHLYINVNNKMKSFSETTYDHRTLRYLSMQNADAYLIPVSVGVNARPLGTTNDRNSPSLHCAHNKPFATYLQWIILRIFLIIKSKSKFFMLTQHRHRCRRPMLRDWIDIAKSVSTINETLLLSLSMSLSMLMTMKIHRRPIERRCYRDSSATDRRAACASARRFDRRRSTVEFVATTGTNQQQQIYLQIGKTLNIKH